MAQLAKKQADIEHEILKATQVECIGCGEVRRGDKVIKDCYTRGQAVITKICCDLCETRWTRIEPEAPRGRMAGYD